MNPRSQQVSHNENKGDPRTYAIIGAAMEVHQVLGRGFLEPVHQEALALELAARRTPHRREVELPMRYKGRPLRTQYRADFVCYDAVIVELKALGQLTGRERAQVINYLKATTVQVALLMNFGTSSLEYERLVNTQQSQSAESAKSADET